jgi:5-methylcytosine-specific restriction endonuclease McrA
VSRGVGKLHTGSKAWRRVRARVLERDAGVCQLRLPGCKLVADEVDHVVPSELGGALYDEDNCVRVAARATGRAGTVSGASAPRRAEPGRGRKCRGIDRETRVRMTAGS